MANCGGIQMLHIRQPKEHGKPEYARPGFEQRIDA